MYEKINKRQRALIQDMIRSCFISKNSNDFKYRYIYTEYPFFHIFLIFKTSFPETYQNNPDHVSSM